MIKELVKKLTGKQILSDGPPSQDLRRYPAALSYSELRFVLRDRAYRKWVHDTGDKAEVFEHSRAYGQYTAALRAAVNGPSDG